MTAILGALKWSLAGKIISTLVQPVTYILIAKMVGPSEMGKYSILLMMVSLAQVIWEGGLSKSIIQSENIGYNAEKTYRTANLLLGTFVSIVLLITSKQIALYFNISEVIYIRLLSLVILFNSISVYDLAYMHKSLDYRALFKLDIIAVLFPSILALIFAFYVRTILPLLLILVASSLIRIIYLKTYRKWNYYFFLQRNILKQIFSFSLFVQTTLLCSWAVRWIDIFILKKYFDLDTIGLFRTSLSLTNSLSALCFAFIVPVAYSYFANGLKKDIKKIANFTSNYMRGIELSAFLLFWLFSLTTYCLEWFFSAEWSGLSSIALLLFFRELHFRYYALNVEGIRALGLSRVELYGAITQVVIIVVGMIIMPKQNIENFALGYTLIAVLASMTVEIIFGVFYLNFSRHLILRNISFSISIILLLVVLSYSLLLFYLIVSICSLITLRRLFDYIKTINYLKRFKNES